MLRPDRHLALIGMAGVGKSTVGRKVAVQVRRPLVDLDVAIAARRGATIEEIFAAEGEAGFRAVETEVLASVLDEAPLVIATGGGVVLSAENRRLLADRAVSVWLRAGEEVLVGRLRRSRTSRPLLADDLEGSVARLLSERTPLYAEVADVVVDVDDHDTDGVAALVVEAVS